MTRRLIALIVGLAVPFFVLGASALASVPAPHWSVNSVSFPTNFAAGDSSGHDLIKVTATNSGGAATDGSTITLSSAALPAGLTLDAAGPRGEGTVFNPLSCSEGPPISCSDTETVGPGQTVTMYIPVDVAADAPASVSDVADVAGGGAPSASTEASITISSTPASYGVQSFDNLLLNPDGSEDTQAGSHPYEMSTAFELNSAFGAEGELQPSGTLKDVNVALPPGLIGDPYATPQCSHELFLTEFEAHPACPDDTAVGVIRLELGFGSIRLFKYLSVYNLVPSPGFPAQLGFSFLGQFPVLIDTSVRTGGDYGLSATVHDISQSLVIYGSWLTVWGVPTDPIHDTLRGKCLSPNGSSFGSCPTNLPPEPFLTVPRSCTGPLSTTFSSDSWQQPGVFVSRSATSEDSFGDAVGLDGCSHLEFAPSISAAPDTVQADTPAGLTVEVKAPVGGLLAPEGLAPADIQNTTVVLPRGVVINPGQAAGLQACGPGQDAAGVDGPPSCPAASKVGTVQITTPLLADKVEGNVYVLQSNPPELRLLVAASADGVQVNLVGNVHLDAATGQLTTTFAGTPQLPFTAFRLSFSGGAQAALATPPTCGVYSTSSDFTPWTAPFAADAFLTDSFGIESGPGGGACPSVPLPFSPSMIAGSTTDQAGGYTSFSLLLQRADAQQRISTLQFKTPQGLLGKLSEVALCPEPEASQGACPASSQIGHTVVAAGPGPYPLVVPQPGQPPAPIYLTGPYKGAPYGLSIVVPLVVGPFTLQTQVVRAKIEVDPHTAQLTVTTDALPSIVDGIPTDLRTVNAVIDRPGFMFNPTNCSPQAFSGTATSTEGATAAISSHFQMGSCQSLAFKPDFKVSTSGKTSRAGGASLQAQILYPATPLGANQASSQSNIASVKVDLPKQLPSRLTTLQKACTAKQFEADPAGCPAASVVGHATAVTPVLPVALSGPAYFVSHGGEAFPSLIVVLQGYGVTIDLVGSTFISKAGITSSTFKQVPDVPITSFTLTLPEGKYSALAANGDLCTSSLVMPTAFTAQNGAVIKQNTPITTNGCPNTLAISLKVNKRTLSLSVTVPAAGQLKISGKGLSSSTKTAQGHETLAININQKQARKLTTKIKITFTQKANGKKQTKTLPIKLTK
jgi:hypothetical protein